MTLIQEGHYEEGLAALSKAMQESPNTLSHKSDYLRSKEQIINRLLASAANSRAAERADEAVATYQRILKIDAENEKAQAGLAAVEMDQRHAEWLASAQKEFDKGALDAAKGWLNSIFLENSNHPRALVLLRKVNEQIQKESVGVPTLLPKFKKPVTLQFRDASLKMIFEALSKASGINVLLDKDIRNDAKATIFVKDVSVEDAIDLILMQNQMEKKVLGENTVFIYPNTPAKQKDYQDLKIRRFHLTNADAKQIQALLKTILKTRDIFIDEPSNSVVIRDTPDAIRLAEKLVAEQDIPEPEVMMEVEVIEVSRSKLLNLGVQLPDSLTLGVPAGSLNQLLSANRNTITATGVSGTLNLHLDDGETNVLASPRIRARNREKAKILIGSRVPVITNSVTPVSTGTPVVTGNVQYLDVGLKLDVEPDVRLDGDVAIKVNLEVSTITKEVTNTTAGQTGGTLAYEIGTRTAATVLRLRDGETQILAGLINDEDRQTANKFPGLGQLPILGRLFSSHKDDTKKTEIILSITPHIVRNPQDHDAQKMEFWSGTESSLKSGYLLLKPGTISTSASGGGQPPVGAKMPAVAVPSVVAPAPAAAPGASDAESVDTPAAQSPASLQWQGPTSAKLGDTFNVVLSAASGRALSRVGLMVGFDPTVLKAVDVVEGEYFKQGGVPSSFVKQMDQVGGRAMINLSGSVADAGAVEGSVAVLTFEVISVAKPQVDVTTSRVVAAGSGGEMMLITAPAPYSINLIQK